MGGSKHKASFQKVQTLKKNFPEPKEAAPLGIQSKSIIIISKEHCFYFFRSITGVIHLFIAIAGPDLFGILLHSCITCKLLLYNVFQSQTLHLTKKKRTKMFMFLLTGRFSKTSLLKSKRNSYLATVVYKNTRVLSV